MAVSFPYFFAAATNATGAQLDANFKKIGDMVAAASGIATLDVNSKVVQEPASKALANGIASLDVNSNLVQKAFRFVDTVNAVTLKMKTIAIGTWNIYVAGGGALTKAVVHGVTLSKIISIEAIIINNAGTERHQLNANLVGRLYADANNINLVALATASGGILDAAAFNAATGFIMVWYSE